MMHASDTRVDQGRKRREARPGLPASDNADLINGV